MILSSSNQRNIYLDALKGVGIFLMIIGHVMSPIRNIIFSFHMPLFFFISGYLYKDRTSKEIIIRNARKVLLPYVMTCLLIWIFFILKFKKIEWGLAIFLANGTDTVWNFSGLMVGPLWFMVCYVMALLLFHYILKIENVFSQFVFLLILWGVAYFIKCFLGLQPLGILNAVPATCCLWIGYKIKNDKIKKIVTSPLSIISGLLIWFVCFHFGSLSMAGLTYKLGLLQLIGAFYPTYIIYKMLKINKLNFGGKVFAYIGKLSMVFLCVHSVDYMLNVSTSIVRHFNLSDTCGIPLDMSLKLLFVFVGVFIIKQMPFLKNIFSWVYH